MINKTATVFMLLLIAACSPMAEPVEETAVDAPVTDEELADVDEVLDELDNLDAELDLDAELAALDEDLQ